MTTIEMAPRYREPSAAEKMGRWIQDNMHHILSGIGIFAVAEGFNLTNILENDWFREGVTNSFGENAGYGGRALIDFHPAHGEGNINAPGNVVLPAVTDGDKNGIADKDFTFEGQKYAAGELYIDRANDGTPDADGADPLQQIANDTNAPVNAWTQYGGIHTYEPNNTP